jgi:DNA polymerase-3 subunit delta
MAKKEHFVYLLQGEEDLLVEQALTDLLDRLIPVADRALNLDVVYADEVPVGDLITKMDTLPFFGPRRVVVVKGVDAWKPADQDYVAAYLEQGPPPSAVIFIAEALDRRRRLYTTVRRIGEIREFPRLFARDVPAWIRTWARDHKVRIDPDAVDALVALVGTGLRQIAMELEKILAYVGDRQSIGVRDVEATASHLAESTIFMLVDAIGERRTDTALRYLGEILRDAAPPYVLFMIARQFRMLLRTVTLVRRKTSAAMLPQVLGVPPFVARRYAEQARNFPLASFPPVFARLQEADYAVKTTGLPRLALETLIVSLCTNPALAPVS